MRLLLGVCVCLGALAGTASARAEEPASLRYELSARAVEAGEPFQLTLVVTSRGDGTLEDVRMPEFPPALAVLRESSATSTQVSFGRTRSFTNEQRFVYVLRADTPGSYTIGEATARFEGGEARAAAVTIVVRPSTGAPPGRPPESNGAGARFGDQLPPVFVEVSADRPTAFVGQQITVTTALFSQRPLSQVPRVAPLKPPGFLCVSLLEEQRPPPGERVVGGAFYYVYVLNRDALFPLAPGETTIPEQAFDFAPSASVFGSRGRTVRVSSSPLTLRAQALPPPPPEHPGSPNVGVWNLTASVRPARVALGEPVTLSIAVEGSGSLEQLVLPSWDGGGKTRVFPAASRIEPRPPSSPEYLQGGRVVVDVLLQPQREGRLEIPALPWTSFDPVQGAYQTLATPPLSVDVVASAIDLQGPPRGKNAAAKALVGKGPRPLETHLSSPGPMPGIAMGAGAALLCAGFATNVVRAVQDRRRTSGAGQRARVWRDIETRLQDAQAREDLAGLERAVLDAAAAAFGDAIKGHTSSELVEVLRARGSSPEHARELAGFIQDIEAARFMPGGGTERARLVATAAGLVRTLKETRP